MQICARTSKGKSLTLEVESTDTINTIKSKIQETQGIRVEQQRLMFMGKQLKDDHKLADYNVISQSTLHVLLCLRGGRPKGPKALISFVDLDNASSLKTAPYDTNAPKWRKWIKKGLNVEGICTNLNCEANGQRVICPKGYAILDVANIVGDNPCLAYELFVKPTTSSFTDCAWMYEGRKPAPKASVPKPRSSLSTTISNFVRSCFIPVKAEMIMQTSKQEVASPWYRAQARYEYLTPRARAISWNGRSL